MATMTEPQLEEQDRETLSATRRWRRFTDLKIVGRAHPIGGQPIGDLFYLQASGNIFERLGKVEDYRYAVSPVLALTLPDLHPTSVIKALGKVPEIIFQRINLVELRGNQILLYNAALIC